MSSASLEAPASLTSTSVPGANFDAWWTLAITFLLNMVSYLDRSIVSMLVPEIKSSLTLSDSQIGLVIGPAFAVAYAVFSLPLGWAADRFSRRLVIALGAVMFGIATILSGFVGSFLILLIARASVAIGETSLAPAAASLISDKFPRRLLTTAISIYATGLKMGGSAALALGALAIVYSTQVIQGFPALQGLEPWRLVFVITGLPALVLGLMAYTLKEPARNQSVVAAWGGGMTAFQFLRSERRLFVPMLIGFSLLTMCGSSLIGWVPTFVTRQYGWKPVQYGPLLGAIGLASSLTLVLKGALMDWPFVRGIKDIYIRFYNWLLIATLPLVATLFLVQDPWVFTALYAVVAIVTIPNLAYAMVVVQAITPPNLRGRLSAILGLVIVLASGVGPAIVGFLTDHAFRDEAKIGYSLATLFCTAIPSGIVCFFFCLAPLRDAVRSAEKRTDTPSLAVGNS